MGLSYPPSAIDDDNRWQEDDASQKCSDFPPQRCVFDFVNFRAEIVDLNGCIVASVHRKSAANHVEVKAGCLLPRIFDNET